MATNGQNIYMDYRVLNAVMHLIKLGGSVITDKRELYSFRDEVARRLIGEIVESGKDFALVHGAGSFGHIVASKYKLQDGFLDKDQIPVLSRVHWDVRVLNTMLLELLKEQGTNPISLPPCSLLMCDNREISNFNGAVFESCAKLGMTPVTFGDVVFDTKLGFCICSGDDLMLSLSKVLRPESAIFVADVDGIFDKNPAVHDNAKIMKRVDQKVLGKLKGHESKCTKCRNRKTGDATGGMLRKAEIMVKIAQSGTDAILLNGLESSRLKEYLSGDEVKGTVVKAKGN
ncbi:MAG: isopentenyl phosphate kinase family protein [Thermoplasmata archaeon]|nr:isopentenyl phosphate kinase family protein [Thermoplasmata archaeon]